MNNVRIVSFQFTCCGFVVLACRVLIIKIDKRHRQKVPWERRHHFHSFPERFISHPWLHFLLLSCTFRYARFQMHLWTLHTSRIHFCELYNMCNIQQLHRFTMLAMSKPLHLTITQHVMLSNVFMYQQKEASTHFKIEHRLSQNSQNRRNSKIPLDKQIPPT